MIYCAGLELHALSSPTGTRYALGRGQKVLGLLGTGSRVPDFLKHATKQNLIKATLHLGFFMNNYHCHNEIHEKLL